MKHYDELNNPEVLEREKVLHDELGRLSKQQSEALQKAIFLTFTRDKQWSTTDAQNESGKSADYLAKAIIRTSIEQLLTDQTVTELLRLCGQG